MFWPCILYAIKQWETIDIQAERCAKPFEAITLDKV